jgi:hypothetical protein
MASKNKANRSPRRPGDRKGVLRVGPIEDVRARVFISCGQSKGTDEESTATAIASRLQELGFDTYIAVQEQTLRGLKENIFGQLEKSEYYIFVDFKRELLQGSNLTMHRGSLFSHQELALASYLDIDVLALQESGVKTDDGILRFLQANATQFSDRHLLANVIADKVQERGWNPRWRNDLLIGREIGQFHDADRVEAVPGRQPRFFKGRFFHIDVRNRHRSKIATNCYVYLERAINRHTSAEIPLKTVEFKWAGYVLPNAHILPGQIRRFDAFWIAHERPTQLQFNVYCDASDYIPHIEGEGAYRLSYAVVADNFPPARRTFILDLNKSLELTTLVDAW